MLLCNLSEDENVVKVCHLQVENASCYTYYGNEGQPLLGPMGSDISINEKCNAFIGDAIYGDFIN